MRQGIELRRAGRDEDAPDLFDAQKASGLLLARADDFELKARPR
jgi:hypothetical protein